MARNQSKELLTVLDLLWIPLGIAALHSVGLTSLRVPFHAELLEHNIVTHALEPAKKFLAEGFQDPEEVDAGVAEESVEEPVEE